MRIFSIAQDFISKKPNASFEVLCAAQQDQTISRIQSFKSCGNTMKHFASLFISTEQINSNVIANMIDGTAMYCYWSNPNIVFLSLTQSQLYQKLSESQPIISEYFDSAATSWCRFQACRGLISLERELMYNDYEEVLPRIFFCSLAWVTLLRNGSSKNAAMTDLASPSILKELDINTDDDEDNLRDHKFTIIKHSNNHFQIVQGYIGDQEILCANAKSRLEINNKLQIDKPMPFMGQDLREWQSSDNIYCNRLGFDRETMQGFLVRLKSFASNDSFDPHMYKSMFSVLHLPLQQLSSVVDINNDGVDKSRAVGSLFLHENGKDIYWPSLSFRELTDDYIVGCGHRDVAISLENFIKLETASRLLSSIKSVEDAAIGMEKDFR